MPGDMKLAYRAIRSVQSQPFLYASRMEKMATLQRTHFRLVLDRIGANDTERITLTIRVVNPHILEGISFRSQCGPSGLGLNRGVIWRLLPHIISCETVSTCYHAAGGGRKVLHIDFRDVHRVSSRGGAEATSLRAPGDDRSIRA